MSPVNEPATPRYEIVSLLRLALHSWQRLKATRWSTSPPCWRRDAQVYALGDVVSAQERPELLEPGQAGQPGRQCGAARASPPPEPPAASRDRVMRRIAPC